MDLFGIQIAYEPVAALKIEGRVTVFEVLSLIGFVIAIASLIVAVRASRDQAKTRRAEFSFRVWQAFMQDDVQKAYLDIEWGRFEWPFQSDEAERGIDRLLYLLDELAILHESGVLARADRDRWEYQSSRVFSNEYIKLYLGFLDGFFKDAGVQARPHDAARRVFARQPQRRTLGR